MRKLAGIVAFSRELFEYSHAEDMVRQILLEKTAPAFDLTMFSHELSAVLTELQQVLAAERAKVLDLPPLRSVRRVN